MNEHQLEERRLALEEKKHADELALSHERLEQERRQLGRFSGAAVTLIGSAIALFSTALTALIAGVFGIWTTTQDNESKFKLQQEDVRGQLSIKKVEVEGQLELQGQVAKAERERLEIQQKLEIIVQATKGLPPDVAAENLRFFVDAGILEDSEGRIRRLAEAGKAPELPADSGGPNPLLERLDVIDVPKPPSAGSKTSPSFEVKDGIVLGAGSTEVTHIETENLSGKNDPKLIVMHYTAGSGDAAINAMTSGSIGGSAHLIVRRDGSVVQLLPLDYQARHAGRSEWGTLKNINSHSISVELENYGKLGESSDGWIAWNGALVPPEEVVEATHRSESVPSSWHAFTELQLEVLIALLQALVASDADLVDLVGHDDIAPRRRLDPGPAFPMEEIRAAVFGRSDPLPPPT